MKYNCPHCDYEYEGQSNGTKEIIKHEKIHPENTPKEAVLKSFTVKTIHEVEGTSVADVMIQLREILNTEGNIHIDSVVEKEDLR